MIGTTGEFTQRDGFCSMRGACMDIPYFFYWRLAAVGCVVVSFLFTDAFHHIIGAEVILL